MTDDNVKRDVETIRELLKTQAAVRPDGTVRHYGREAREAAVAYAKEQRAAEVSYTEIARALDVKDVTIAKWMRDAGATRARPPKRKATPTKPLFLPVAVMKGGAASKRTYTLVSPTGWRVEGLDAEGVRELLGTRE